MTTGMHPQLELLLQIQDLRSQRDELAEGEAARAFEEQEFGIDVDEAISQLDAKIDEILSELDVPIRSRLDRMMRGGNRTVVPLINGVCYGCFTALPTAEVSSLRREAVSSCGNCGRFLYMAG
jgi:predicted  nucleic acid-binding Zn-ribbon protein